MPGSLEMRQTLSMSDQINSYITQLEAVGFVPNAKATSRKRGSLDPDALMTKRDTPEINLVVNLLEGHGFEPATTTSVHTIRDVPISRDISLSKRAIIAVVKRAITILPKRAITALAQRGFTSLTKRTIPDINLVVSLLEARGFVPSGKKTSRSVVEKRQSASDINTVINELIAYGYNPSDFGPAASRVINAFLGSLPKETTALCPKDNNTLYATGGNTYEILCNIGWGGNDLPPVPASNLAGCLASCSSYTPSPSVAGGAKCIAASWEVITGETNNCHRKYAIPVMSSDYRAAGRNINFT